jgi:hypothetical protein
LVKQKDTQIEILKKSFNEQIELNKNQNNNQTANTLAPLNNNQSNIQTSS